MKASLFVVICCVAILIEAPFRIYKPSSDEDIFNLLVPVPLRKNELESKLEKKILFCTMLTDDFHNYAKGSVQLIQNVPKQLKNIHAVVFEIAERPIPLEVWFSLREAGWAEVQTVSRIAPRHEGREEHARFQDQFTKLHLWNFSRDQYEWVLYMDSDMFVVRSLLPLFSFIMDQDRKTRTENFTIYAAEDLPFIPGAFNLGMFAIQPDPLEFNRLLDLLHNENKLAYSERWAEQGFLNAVYCTPQQWVKIPPNLNVNIGLWSHDRDAWNDQSKGMQILHFTMVKPWSWWCPWTEWAPLCFLFWNKASLKFHQV